MSKIISIAILISLFALSSAHCFVPLEGINNNKVNKNIQRVLEITCAPKALSNFLSMREYPLFEIETQKCNPGFDQGNVIVISCSVATDSKSLFTACIFNKSDLSLVHSYCEVNFSDLDSTDSKRDF